ncbi:hypothetical protein HMN09_01215600 [Mycena chlorophos]|uniref:Integrase core domain-containing protein n=1 Tax=Mycena chlorophos TaxID=658473 RepID=A0A8H6VSK5_MYCCL|nr:hypothetical protein HMN09_01215600 [Mycena chlorophos]
MPDPIANLWIAYQTLKHNVHQTLLTQQGAEQQLAPQTTEVLQYFPAAELHRDGFPMDEWTTLEQSINTMVDALNNARYCSSNPPESMHISLTTRISTRGQPRIDIQREVLAESLELRTLTGLRPVFNVSERTIRRRALEYGLRQPGSAPTFIKTSHPDGSVRRARARASTSAQPTAPLTLTDEELSAILETFPNFRRRMLLSHLRAASHHVSRERLAALYLRVHGTPGAFGTRMIHHTLYHNLLWHHDGQHGLIRYKIVIHCFIDGKSRFVTGHGLPRRVRGDHGTENVLVALAMDLLRGLGHYIFGWSVNNTHIERLWYDIMHGFGHKWKLFFVDLELNHGLVPTVTVHIWLIYYLFLGSINADAWNSHLLGRRGDHAQLPRNMIFFSLLQDSLWEIESADEPVEPDIGDPALYGIDWDVVEDACLMEHLRLENPQDWDDRNPFAAGTPENLSHVPCDAPPRTIFSRPDRTSR